MKIGLYLKKAMSDTKCPGVWGDEIWAKALAKGLQKLLPKDKVFVFGENMGFAPEVDIAIYFHLFTEGGLIYDVKFHGKKNVFIQQNYTWEQEKMAAMLKPYIWLGTEREKVATISPTYSERYDWKLLYPAVDLDLFKPSKGEGRYACDVLYVGNNIKGQEKTGKYLSAPVDYKTFGNGFDAPMTLRESIKAFPAATTNLNFFFKSDVEIITARIFQIAACKGLVMTEEKPEIKAIFGDTMLWLDDSKDIQFQIKNQIRWAKDNPKKTTEMKEAAYQIVVEKYNSDVQAKALWEFVNE